MSIGSQFEVLGEVALAMALGALLGLERQLGTPECRGQAAPAAPSSPGS